VTLAGEVAVVTGGSRGVGRAAAEALERAGARVAAWGRADADVTDAAAVERAVERVRRELGEPTLLVTAAGTANAIGPAWELAPADWWADVESNLLGTYHAVRAVLPRMLERDAGRILLVSSYVAARPSPYLSAYAAAKAGVVSLAEGLAAATADTAVRVFAVTPGRVRTDMTRHMVESETGRRWLPEMQRGEWLDAGRFTDLVLFLASGRGDALSGRFLHALDDVDELVRRTEEIEREELYAPRLRRLPPPD
jgi:NAD(P)-dependent dehydrogenase (short-subunit alcohol dehydrogenase family)